MDACRSGDVHVGLRVVEAAERPFRYFLAVGHFEPAIEVRTLEWFEEEAPWSLAQTDFYEQFEFNLRDAALPAQLAVLTAPSSLQRLRRLMEAQFEVRLGSQVQVVAHRLDPGQRIGIHNDVREDGESHRLTVQLNRGLGDSDGGFFMLFNSEDAADVHRVLRPISGTAIGFEIGLDSLHAVSRLHGGTRYTLVYSFRTANVS